jgi:predicted house-cleaning noncanonical NTP pyrophosphatase (MazG superfamily)
MEACVAGQPSLSATMEAYAMKGKTRETWQEFCEQAAVEQDPDKLLELVREINRMLEEKENRLLRARDQSAGK